jgi:hypothetical protein
MVNKRAGMAMNLRQQNEVKVVKHDHNTRVGLSRYPKETPSRGCTRRDTGRHEHVSACVSTSPVYDALVPLPATPALTQQAPSNLNHVLLNEYDWGNFLRALCLMNKSACTHVIRPL